MTIIQRFTEGTVFKLIPQIDTDEELLLRVESRTEKRLELTNLLQGGNTLSRSIEEIESSLANGNVEFVINSPDSQEEDPLSEDLACLPKKHREKVVLRFKYISKLRQLVETWTHKSLTPLIPKIARELNDSNPPGWRTLARWNESYSSNGQTIKALFSGQMKQGNWKSRFSDEVEGYIKDAIETYKTKERISIHEAWDNLDGYITKANKTRSEDDQFETPCYDVLRKRIKAEPPYEIMVAREGKRKADIEFASVGMSLKLERALQRVEVDHTKLDVFVVDDENYMPLGRPWLTTSIDAMSRSITGFYIGFHPPSFLSLTKLLKSIIIPKTYIKERYPEMRNPWVCSGVPELFVFDNGKEFWSKDLEIVLAELNIQTQYNPVQKPWLKGKIERLYGTINKKLLVDLPGKTFSNIFEKGDYDPEKNAVITFSTFLEILYTWVIDVYQQQPVAKGTIIPDLAWKEGILDFPPRHVDPKRLDIILGRTKYSKLRRGGIQYLNLKYDSDELAKLRGKIGSTQVMYKVDPDDLGHIHVFNESERKYIKVLAVDHEYAVGLSEWQHKVHKKYARKYIRKKYKHDDVVAARDAIKELVKREIENWENRGRKGKAGATAKAARYGKVADDSSGSLTDIAASSSDKPQSYPGDEGGKKEISDDWSVAVDRSGWSAS
ncbi:Mu transposase C-terminal domain-containing protein [Endozoicomonas ascidiicola]|uniref:Mu transposase C-terminal domain-containing protein n=1 Tax=Endozoicomonas ascidiicola TaxID=1698521 RepID=UPI00082CF2CE|nr:Mu transposase C-terminal domain-containing protein [Endozoicomonas ascidiicola]